MEWLKPSQTTFEDYLKNESNGSLFIENITLTDKILTTLYNRIKQYIWFLSVLKDSKNIWTLCFLFSRFFPHIVFISAMDVEYTYVDIMTGENLSFI